MSKINQLKFKSKKGTAIIIRSAKIADAAAIVKLNKEIIKEGKFMLHEIDEYNATVKTEKQQIKRLNDSASKLYLVAETNNMVIGYLTFNNGSLKRTAHAGFLSMFIKKKYRGIGVGQMLLSELINWAGENPALEKISLAVFSTNLPAIYLYRKMGFKKEGYCPRDMKINGKYVDSVLMYRFV